MHRRRMDVSVSPARTVAPGVLGLALPGGRHTTDRADAHQRSLRQPTATTDPGRRRDRGRRRRGLGGVVGDALRDTPRLVGESWKGGDLDRMPFFHNTGRSRRGGWLGRAGAGTAAGAGRLGGKAGAGD
jgi:hypothetical protein